jgi:hypothetical protein
MDDSNLAEQARGLREDVAGLAGSVTALAQRTAQSDRTVARLRRITIGLVACFAAGLMVAAYLVVLNRQVNDLARCQAAYNEINNQRTRALTEVTADERAAERRAIDLLFSLLRDPSLAKPASERTNADRKRIAALAVELRAAAETLQVERAKADLARTAHPVPAPPSQSCRP